MKVKRGSKVRIADKALSLVKSLTGNYRESVFRLTSGKYGFLSNLPVFQVLSPLRFLLFLFDRYQTSRTRSQKFYQGTNSEECPCRIIVLDRLFQFVDSILGNDIVNRKLQRGIGSDLRRRVGNGELQEVFVFVGDEGKAEGFRRSKKEGVEFRSILR